MLLRVMVVVAAVVTLLVLSTANLGSWCDGSFPAWVAERANGGCVQTPSLLEYLAPWHWGAPDVCLGLCTTLRGG